MRLSMEEVCEAVATYAVKRGFVPAGAIIDVRLKLVDEEGEKVTGVLTGLSKGEPQFVADIELKSFGKPGAG